MAPLDRSGVQRFVKRHSSKTDSSETAQLPPCANGPSVVRDRFTALIAAWVAKSAAFLFISWRRVTVAPCEARLVRAG
jgi:hypothetical protein